MSDHCSGGGSLSVSPSLRDSGTSLSAGTAPGTVSPSPTPRYSTYSTVQYSTVQYSTVHRLPLAHTQVSRSEYVGLKYTYKRLILESAY